jgi:hypothetical protein
MKRTVLALAALSAVVLPSCGRRKAELYDIVPSVKFNRTKVPLGSAVEVTSTWTVEATAKKVPNGYNAFIHFLDSHKVLLVADSHQPVPAPESWEPGKSYSYTRTVFIPVYPYVGDVEVRTGLFPVQGKRQRLGLKGDDAGLNEYRVGKIEFQPQTENIFLVYKEGWHNPEAHPQNASVERTWTKKEALVSFKNPKKDVLLYLEADTCFKCFPEQPVLTVSVNNKAGLAVPIESADVFLKKVRFKAEDLGSEDWVDLRFSMNQSFVPKLLTPPMNNDDRELGLLVYHLFVGELDKLGAVPAETIVDATPLAPPAPVKGAKAPAKGAAPTKPAAKPSASPAPAAKKS